MFKECPLCGGGNKDNAYCKECNYPLKKKITVLWYQLSDISSKIWSDKCLDHSNQST